MTLGERLRHIRQHRGWTMVALAINARISYPLLANLETGKAQSTSPEVLNRLAHALNVDVVWLVTGHGKESP